MKKILLYMGIALAAIGCAKDEMNDTTSDGAINFSAGVTTRVSESDDCAWDADDKIGIFTNQTDEDNLLFTISDTETGALQNKSETGLYPLASGSRTYYAYHPYDSTLDGETTIIDIDCTNQSSIEPLLWATATSYDTNVALQFSHMYTKVIFNLTAGGLEITSFDNVKVTLSGANATATFDIESGKFTDKSITDITLTIDNDDTITAYLPPMDAVSGNVKLYIYDSVDENTFINTITTTAWESGNSYEYDITVGEKIPDFTNDGGDYFVYTATGMFVFAEQVNGGDNNDINCTLMRDIDLGGAEWTPIGNSDSYLGTFDGGGYVVSGLSVSAASCGGFFGYIGWSAKISNLGVNGSIVGDVAGGVVGYNNGGTITNCYNMGSVSSIKEGNTGGVVGYNNGGTITNCYNTGSVSGYTVAGGVVGTNNSGTITNCYNAASVSASVTTTSYIGGIAGINSDTITNCYWDKETAYSVEYSEGDDSSSTYGKMSTKDMQDPSFVLTLNNNAYDYNNPTSGDKPTITACAWVAVIGGYYPTLDFDGEPTNE